MSSEAKRASERPMEERSIPAALTRLEETFKKMKFLFNTAYYLVHLKLPFLSSHSCVHCKERMV